MITKAVKNLIETFSMLPIEINNGNCEEFAGVLEDMGYGTAHWGDELPKRFWSKKIKVIWEIWNQLYNSSHCFLFSDDGLFYDAECPQGCKYPDELPFFQRKYKIYSRNIT